MADPPSRAAQRQRAARGYVDKTLTEFAKLTGIGRSTLVRTEGGTRTPDEQEWQRIADATGLPLEFFLAEDLSDALRAPDEPSLAERVEALELQVRALTRRVTGGAPVDLVPPPATRPQQPGEQPSSASDPPSEHQAEESSS